MEAYRIHDVASVYLIAYTVTICMVFLCRTKPLYEVPPC